MKIIASNGNKILFIDVLYIIYTYFSIVISDHTERRY